MSAPDDHPPGLTRRQFVGATLAGTVSTGLRHTSKLFDREPPELFLPDHVDKRLDFAKAKGAVAIPHRLGYWQGWRGANWAWAGPIWVG